MPKTVKTPATVLQSLIDEYQISAFSLSKNAHIDYQDNPQNFSWHRKNKSTNSLKAG